MKLWLAEEMLEKEDMATQYRSKIDLKAMLINWKQDERKHVLTYTVLDRIAYYRQSCIIQDKVTGARLQFSPERSSNIRQEFTLSLTDVMFKITLSFGPSKQHLSYLTFFIFFYQIGNTKTFQSTYSLM